MAWTATEIPGSERLHELIGVGAAVLVTVLSTPAVTRSWREKGIWGGSGYTPINANDEYQDLDGVATEESIRAFSDTRPRIAVGLAIFAGIGALIGSNVLIPPTLSDWVFWAEVVCWVSGMRLITHDEYTETMLTFTNSLFLLYRPSFFLQSISISPSSA